MARHFDTPELFGGEVGSGTCGDLHCAFCNQTYNAGADRKGDYHARDSVTYTNFAGLVVCDACFESVEDEIEGRMPQILRWYRQIVERKRAEVARDVKALDDIGLERPIRKGGE